LEVVDKIKFDLNKIPRGCPYFYPFLVMTNFFKIKPNSFKRGKPVFLFEKRFAEYFGAKFAVSFSYARISLYYLLKLFNFPAGSEVLTTPVTIPDIINAIVSNNLKPVFIDFSSNTGNVKVKDIETNINKNTKCILVTHLNGVPSDMDKIREISRKNKLILLEDASQGIGGKFGGRYLGRWGDAGIFSLSTLKPLSTFVGGMVLTDNKVLAAKLRKHAFDDDEGKNFSFLPQLFKEWLLFIFSNKYVFSFFTFYFIKIISYLFPDFIDKAQHLDSEQVKEWEGIPSKYKAPFTNFQANIGLGAIERLKLDAEKRIKLGKILYSQLDEAGVPGLTKEFLKPGCIFWRFPLWVKNPKKIRRYLLNNHIDSTVSGLRCCSREPVFKKFNKSTPEAFKFIDNLIFLPIHSNMNVIQIRNIARIVRGYYE
jgi:dTDP-4-amino-4,6-dideoxygalactose transaminase